MKGVTHVPDVLTVERRDAIAVLTLNRPDQINALGTAVADALADACRELSNDATVRAVIVCGAGRAFSAGADISEFEQLGAPTDFARFVSGLTRAFSALQRLPQPSVAAVHGFAFGGGLELALACDLRVTGPGTRLGVPEIRLGLLPGAGGTQRLPRMLPVGIAKQLILTGDPLSGQRAYDLGLVNELAPTDDRDSVLATAEALALKVAGGAPLALATGKRLVDDGVAMSLDAAIAYERESVSMLFSSDDRAEGVKAFRDKRQPHFNGR
jgi:enoyl-CoA hydratase